MIQHLHAVGADAADVTHRQTNLRVARLGALDVQAHPLANHHFGQFRLVGLRGANRADVASLAQNRHAVGNRHHLVQLVRDDDNRLAVVAHPAQNRKQLFGFLRGQHGGRLVQNQDVRAAVKHFDNLHRLLFGHRHIVNLLVRIKIEAVTRADGFYALRRIPLAVSAPAVQTEDQPHGLIPRPRLDHADRMPAVCGQNLDLLPGDHFQPLATAGNLRLRQRLLRVQSADLLHAQNNIFRSSENIHQFEVLMDHADFIRKRVMRGGNDNILPVDQNMPLVGIINSGDHIHQGRFSAAVLSQK